MKWLLQVLFCCVYLTKQSSSSGSYLEIKKLENVSLTNTEELSGVHSQMQCVLKCRRKFPSKKNIFHSNDGKCFCVSDEVSTSEIGVGVLNGNLILEVCKFMKLYLF